MFQLRTGNVHLSLDDIQNHRYDPAVLHPYEKRILALVKKWYDGQVWFEIETSGATGTPKKIRLHRDQVEAGARLTLQRLRLRAGDTALLCISTHHIGGMMMLIRALTGGLQLFARMPSGTPLAELDPAAQIDFMAMVPYQLKNCIEDGNPQVHCAKAILLGGGPVDAELEEQVAAIRSPVYHTFGMTETASHFALRRINGRSPEKAYITFPGTTITQDERGCLIVRGPMTRGKALVTNELVEVKEENAFVWLGRVDDVINSGGIKVLPAEDEPIIEKWLKQHGHDVQPLLFGLPDAELGERVCLALERKPRLPDRNLLLRELRGVLPRFHAPKSLYLVNKFLYTANGKLRRKETANLIIQQIHISGQ